MPKWLKRLALVLSFVVLVLPPFSILYLNQYKEEMNPGAQLVKLMYHYEYPEQLEIQQEILKTVLSPEQYKELSLENQYRVNNTYVEFGWAPVSVEILDCGDNYVVYEIFNENIKEKSIRVMQYSVQDGVINVLREYKLRGLVEGGYAD